MLRTFRSYCVTHAPSLIPQAFIDYTIGLGRYVPATGSSIELLDPYWHGRRTVAYGAAGSYALPRAVEQTRDESSLIGICTHRKIILQDPIGRESASTPPMREAEPEVFGTLSRGKCLPRPPHDFLVSEPIAIGNVVAHYAHFHHVIDLLDYLSIAVETGVLDPADMGEFVTQEILVTGGCELGVYPREWLLEALAKLERVGRAFLDRHAVRIRGYDNYNVRAVGFLSERLGSFLLIKELLRRYPSQVPAEIYGSICCVVAPGSAYAAARAPHEASRS